MQKNPPILLSYQDKIYVVKYFKKNLSVDIAPEKAREEIQTLNKELQKKIKAAIRKNRSRSDYKDVEETMNIKLSSKTYQKLIDLADQKNITISEVIEELL